MLCQDCHLPTNTGRGAIVVDERLLCSACRHSRLERARSEPTDRCTEPGCELCAKAGGQLTVAQHIAEGKRIVAGAAWAERFESRRGA